MQMKSFSRILDIAGIMSIVGFLATLLYSQLPGVAFSLKVFALIWLLIYLFAATLGFRGSIDAHKEALRGFAAEWIIACLVGIILAVFVIIVG